MAVLNGSAKSFPRWFACPKGSSIRIGNKSRVTVSKVGATRISVLVDAPFLPVKRLEVPWPGKAMHRGRLVFTRKCQQGLLIAGMVNLTFIRTEGEQAFLSVEAPSDVPLWPAQGAKIVALN